jgi:hypothetical protein
VIAATSSEPKVAVIIAMTIVRIVEMSADQIVDVISVRYGFVATTRTVVMTAIMTGTFVTIGAIFWIGGADGDGVLVYMSGMRMVQMPVV